MIRSFSVFLVAVALTASSVVVRAQDYWQKTETSPGGSGADGVVTTLVVNAKGHIFGCTSAGVSRSTDDGKSWTLLKNPTGITLGPIFGLNTEGDIFAGAGYINYRSIDDGDTWTKIRIIPLQGFDPAINSLAFARQGGNEMVFGSSSGTVGLVWSSDNGDTWFTDKDANLGGAYPIFVAASPNGTFFATSQTATSRSQTGNIWSPISGAFGANTAFAFGPNNEIVAGGTSGLFLSTNNGDSWKQIDQAPSVVAFALTVTGDGTIYEGQNSVLGASGLFVSTDNGGSWNPQTAGLASTHIHALATSTTGYVYAATDSGVFRTAGHSDVKRAADGSTTSFTLEQISSNPFSSSTTIHFTVPGLSDRAAVPVAINVYDMAGRKVAVVTNKGYQPGTYDAAFSGGELPAGVYLVRLESGEFMQSRTMVYMPR